jgi:multisubunit Na+/H+ antiporter MnhG subunit
VLLAWRRDLPRPSRPDGAAGGINGLSLGLQVIVQDLFYGAALIVAVSISMLAPRRASASRLRRAAVRSTVTPWRRPGS